jgi:hypothetical protein
MEGRGLDDFWGVAVRRDVMRRLWERQGHVEWIRLVGGELADCSEDRKI